MAKKKMLKVTLVRSPIRQNLKHKLCVQGLGLKRMHQTVEVEDTPSVRGMINKVNYLVRIEGEA
jgi:large subunit ribosomal protein L30